MIELLLPSEVVSVEALAGEPQDELLAGERRILANSAQRRREEFAAGRSCARRALLALGQPPQPILAGLDREPIWPSGFVGSITHCSGYCAASVARVRDIAAIGIDAEVNEPLPPGVLDQVAVPAELEWLRGQDVGGICWDRLLFSAKESVFKAWFPLAGGWLGFEDARVSFAPLTRRFEARLLVAGPRLGGTELSTFTGRFWAAEGRVLTAITVPGRPADAETHGPNRANASAVPARRRA